MASPTIERKYALLLSPQRLLTDQMIMELLCIEKTKTTRNYQAAGIDRTEVGRCFPKLPLQAKNVLLSFAKSGIKDIKASVTQRFNTQKAGIDFESYFKNALMRRLHQEFQTLKPFASLVEWHQRKMIEKDRYVISPCSFSSHKPLLEFDLNKAHEDLQVDAMILLNGSRFPYHAFTRHGFLLESRNEYFLLAFKDYQTLEWLDDPTAEAVTFKEKLNRLEADYTVNRNNFLPTTEINVIPAKRVMLSEISNSFLVFTPQFIYDGFLAEGPYKPTFEMVRNGETFVIKRHHQEETDFISMLETFHEKFAKQLNGYYYVSFADAQKKQWFLHAYHKLLAQNIEIVGMDMLQHFRYSPHQVTTSGTVVKQEAQYAFISMKVSFGKEDIPLSELQKLLRVGQRTVMLKDGSFGVLNEEWLKHYGIIFRHGKVVGDEVQVVRWLAFSEDDSEYSSLLRPLLQQEWSKKWLEWQTGADTIYPVPESIKATLRPYQQKGFEWMVLLAEAGAGACLADDMGLGKTLQTICFLAYRLEHDPLKQHLIVCPSSLLYNWQNELSKFAPHIISLLYYGPGRDMLQLQGSESRVVITTYSTLRSDIEQLNSIHFGVVILDESHYIKNPDALTTRAVNQLQSTTRIALTGTPLINNTLDLYSQLNFIIPGMFGNREFFTREYANGIDRDRDPEKIAALKKITAPFIFRRTKAQVASDLPSKSELIMWCNMKSAQKILYEDLKSRIRDSIFMNIKNEGLNKSKMAVLQGMLRLRQVCNSPLLLPEEEQVCTDSVKTELLMYELATNLKAHKVLVFSQFASMLHLIAKACHGQGIAFFHFDGQTPVSKRAEMVAQFQEEENTTNVFLISLKAGNTGLNLTAADYVFLFDPWWNTAVEQQAIDRTHRIGQKNNVFAYKMICKDSIEERIIQIQERKKQLSGELVSEEEGFVKSLTESEIDFLFS